MKTVILIALFWTATLAQESPPNDRAIQRGETRQDDASQTMSSGQSGSQERAGKNRSTWRGILVDAGCRDRTLTNLRRPPTLEPATPVENESADPADSPKGQAARDGAIDSHGIHVDADTARAEREDAMQFRTQDHFTRQMDPSCAVTARTKAFALFLPDGTLLNLDEGGNTYAVAMLQATRVGQSLLNGQGKGAKPRVVVRGLRRGDKLDARGVRME